MLQKINPKSRLGVAFLRFETIILEVLDKRNPTLQVLVGFHFASPNLQDFQKINSKSRLGGAFLRFQSIILGSDEQAKPNVIGDCWVALRFTQPTRESDRTICFICSRKHNESGWVGQNLMRH